MKSGQLVLVTLDDGSKIPATVVKSTDEFGMVTVKYHGDTDDDSWYYIPEVLCRPLTPEETV